MPGVRIVTVSTGEASLRILDGSRPMYWLPDDAVADEVLNPALRHCETFELMAGYFSGAVLAEMAHGLAAYLTRTSSPLRLLISPVLSDDDQRALASGEDPEAVTLRALEAAFQDEIALSSMLARHTKSCLAYLSSHGRLQIKVVVMRHGIFHPKQWTFAAGDDIAVLSGSANATQQGVTRNVEQLRLDLSWRNDDSRQACAIGRERFRIYWDNERPQTAVSIPVGEAFTRGLLQGYSTERPPTEDEYQAALAAEGLSSEEDTVLAAGFRIPSGLVWETGDYRHQGEAVKAWENNGELGVLAIATGGGKTISSLIAAHRLLGRVGSLFVLVAAPTRPLVTQWASEMREFGLTPYVQGSNRTAKKHVEYLEKRIERVARGIVEVDSAVVTNHLVNTPEMKRLLERHSNLVMFVGDEAHNLGAEQFISDPPEVRFRLGLSATPERQYDPDGTADLFDYFGGVVYTFGLDRAIGLCLVPYDYYVHEARLQDDEMDEYRALSAEIRALYARTAGGDGKSRSKALDIKYARRRAILESAVGKIGVLRELLVEADPKSVSHTLIYCTDKNPEQLISVNELLRSLGISFHQLTEAETQASALVAAVIDNFRSGAIQVLTAKRVLDEGFNIPEISTAYVLASTTVKRQWVQRRGRVLRLCPAIGKTSASLHDVVTMPPDLEVDDEDAKRLIRGELARVSEFAELAQNRHSDSGPYAWIQDVTSEFSIVLEHGEVGNGQE